MTQNSQPTMGQVWLARDECDLLKSDLNRASALIEGTPDRQYELSLAYEHLERIAQLMGFCVVKMERKNA